MQGYTRAEVAQHTTYNPPIRDVWVIYKQQVYNISKFVFGHPGGDEILKQHAGQDVTIPFDETGHSPLAQSMFASYLIGTVLD